LNEGKNKKIKRNIIGNNETNRHLKNEAYDNFRDEMKVIRGTSWRYTEHRERLMQSKNVGCVGASACDKFTQTMLREVILKNGLKWEVDSDESQFYDAGKVGMTSKVVGKMNYMLEGMW
jgi:hypothetical protein